MTVKKIVALEIVNDDLNEGEAFYNSIEFGVGSYFRTSLISEMESLKLYAGIHKKVYGYYRMLSKRFPYAIYYDIKGDIVIVVAVVGVKMNPVSIKKRITKGKDI